MTKIPERISRQNSPFPAHFEGPQPLGRAKPNSFQWLIVIPIPSHLQLLLIGKFPLSQLWYNLVKMESWALIAIMLGSRANLIHTWTWN